MTLPSEKLVRDTVAGYEMLSARIKEVAIQVARIQDVTRNPIDDYVEFGFDGGTPYGKFSYICYGDLNEEVVYFPLEYLWTENFAEIEKARFAVERAEEKRLAEEKAFVEIIRSIQ